MDDNLLKTICLAAFFLESLVFGCLPFFLLKRSAFVQIKVISYLNCFAGGVFLGACMLHLLVEGRETLEEYFKLIGVKIKFPVYEAITAGGFFFIAFIEQLTHMCLDKSQVIATPEHKDQTRSYDDQSEVSMTQIKDMSINTVEYDISTLESKTKSKSERNGLWERRGITAQRVLENELYQSSPNVLPVTPQQDGIQTTPECAPKRNRGRRGSTIPGSTAGLANFAIESEVKISSNEPKSNGAIKVAVIDDSDDAIVKVMQVHPMRAFLLLGAFSFHTVFDGLAVGLQQDQNNIWQMFFAISIHKSLVSLCLGLQLFLVWRKPIKTFLSIFFFSLISPIGVGIGMVVNSVNINVYAQTLSRGVLEGLSTGTFLYVAFFEILHKELGEKKGLSRLFLVILGFAGTIVPKLFHGEE